MSLLMTPEITRYRLRHRTRPLDVWVAGDGPALLLLHGWGLGGTAYKRAALALAELGRRVVAPSIAVHEQWSIERMAETAAEALAGVDAAPAAVVGHSYGGVVGAQLAIAHRDFVSAYIAVDSPLASLGGIRAGRALLPGPHYRIATNKAAAAAFARTLVTRGSLRSLAASAAWVLRNGHEASLRALAESGLPRAVVWAERDGLLPLSHGERAAELLRCTLHVVRHDERWTGRYAPDHDWPFCEPKHFAETIVSILRDLPEGATA